MWWLPRKRVPVSGEKEVNPHFPQPHPHPRPLFSHTAKLVTSFRRAHQPDVCFKYGWSVAEGEGGGNHLTRSCGASAVIPFTWTL